MTKPPTITTATQVTRENKKFYKWLYGGELTLKFSELRRAVLRLKDEKDHLEMSLMLNKIEN